ncbi:MAG TPA: hypothetical protein VKT81_21245 [Bryobacteraceae bacterium]|nr:hypothetical protein [Bryobacteraceae bacterium]
MADQLYLSYILEKYSEENMLRHYEKLLGLFPFSRLAKNPSTFKVIPVNLTEPAVLEVPMAAPVSIEQVISAARDFQNADSCYRLETWWDLWQFDVDWKLAPARASLVCFGPEFEREEDADLEIEFGIDAHFLPQPEIPGSLVTIQSNIKSLLKLVHDLDDALPVETRRLWSESGENFSEKLQQKLATDGHG